MIECPECGKEDIDEESKHCPNCGHKLEKEEAASNPSKFESIDRSKGMLAVLTVLIAATAFLLILPDNSNNPTADYLEVQEFTWEKKDAALRRTSDGGVKASGKLELKTTTDNLYVKIYSLDYDGRQLVRQEKLYTEGKHTVESSGYIPRGIEELELMICFSQKSDFDSYSQNTECKRQTFSIPRVSLTVEPDPVEIDISKPEDRFRREDWEKVTVRNNGKLPIKIYRPNKTSEVESNSVDVWFEDIRQVPTRYRSDEGFFVSLTLRPKESASFYVNTAVRDDSRKGSYRVTGFIPSLRMSGDSSDALAGENFDVKVNVE